MSKTLDDERIKARARAREKAAAKEESEKTPEPWPDPVALEAPAAPAEPFPLEVLPSSMRELCLDISEAVNCPVDYAACSMLGLTAGAIGAQVEVEIKPGYQERSCLYIGMVGGSSARKSPPMKILQRAVIAEQSRRVTELSKLTEDCIPSVYEHGQGEILIGDITTEELGMMMLRQPRGLTLTMEELVGWLRGQNMYRPGGKGNDRQFYLQVWDGTALMVNRVNSARKIWVPRPTLSVLGGMQPDIVREFLTIRDGFAERILFAFPDPKPAREENWLTVSPKLLDLWEQGLQRIWRLEMKKNENGGRPTPHVMRFDRSARVQWQEHTRNLANIRNGGELPEALQSCFGKLDGYGARLALVLHLLDSAVGGPSPRDLTGEWMAAGAKLAMYFGENAKRAYAVGGISSRSAAADATTAGAKKIIHWAVRNGMSSFLRSQAYAALRGTFASPDDMAGSIRLLTQCHVLRYASDGWSGKGRKPTPSFEVHPAVMDGRFAAFDAAKPKPIVIEPPSEDADIPLDVPAANRHDEMIHEEDGPPPSDLYEYE